MFDRKKMFIFGIFLVFLLRIQWFLFGLSNLIFLVDLKERYYYFYDKDGEIEVQKNNIIRLIRIKGVRICVFRLIKIKEVGVRILYVLGQGIWGRTGQGFLGRWFGRRECFVELVFRSFVCSELILFYIGVWVLGEWECFVFTVQGNVSKKVEIVVLEIFVFYCFVERVVNNRGDFRFGQFIVVEI